MGGVPLMAIPVFAIVQVCTAKGNMSKVGDIDIRVNMILEMDAFNQSI